MVAHRWTLRSTRAGTGPCTATGPGPEQAPHKYIRTDQNAALTQQRGVKGTRVEGSGKGLGPCGRAEGRVLALLRTQHAPWSSGTDTAGVLLKRPTLSPTPEPPVHLDRALEPAFEKLLVLPLTPMRKLRHEKNALLGPRADTQRQVPRLLSFPTWGLSDSCWRQLPCVCCGLLGPRHAQRSCSQRTVGKSLLNPKSHPSTPSLTIGWTRGHWNSSN